MHTQDANLKSRKPTKAEAKEAADALFSQRSVENAMKGQGPQFPKSDENPEGYTLDEQARRQPPKERTGSGRKDNGGIEQVPDYRSFNQKAPDGMKLLRNAVEADLLYKEWCKGAGKSTGTNTSTINKLMKASLKGNFEEVKRAIDQQQEMFQECGEIPGGEA